MAAYTTIDDPTIYFNTKLYTGNGGTLAVTGVGFQPDWVWIKNRPDARDHQIYDSVRGVTKVIGSDRTSAEATVSNGLTAFGSDGFTVGADANVNDNGDSHVAWNWKAGGSASSNSDGSITSSVSVNQTAGFSIGTFTGTASVGTVGHGLNAVPSMIINRTITAAKDWMTYHHRNTSAPETDYLALHSTNATADFEDVWNDTAPTSSVFTIGDSSQNNTGSGTSIFYAFAEKQGYSKFGSYVGNNNADGIFVYTGFKPAFFMVKDFSEGSSNWVMFDNKRDGYNQQNNHVFSNTNGAEVSNNADYKLDFLSNGVKFRGNSGDINGTASYIYMAFAESPFVTSTGIPTTAR